jgi:hypothetical protein
MQQNAVGRRWNSRQKHKHSKSLHRETTCRTYQVSLLYFLTTPKIDSAMAHEHLVIAYSLTWFVHLCYLFYVVRKWRSTRRQKV